MSPDDLVKRLRQRSTVCCPACEDVHEIPPWLCDEREEAAEMLTWQPIETAPSDGTPFLALNHDRECYVARIEDGRLQFRRNFLREESHYRVHDVLISGEPKRLLQKINEPWPEIWENVWSIWTRGYEYRPTHWMPIPPPPKD